MTRYTMDTVEVTGLEQNLYDVASNLGTMAETVNNVTGYVSVVNQKVGNVSKEVNTLSEKLDRFMERIEGNTVVTNAKQSIMLSNQELDRKYSHYGEVRRHITGILESIDVGIINKDTLKRVSEEIIIKTPNYWLGKALFALVCWINDDKELANKSLHEAITLDDEKTSLLFFLICLRIKRIRPALIWFNRYLEMQDPSKLDNKIINVINSLITGVYGLDAKKIFINCMTKWEKELNSQSGIKELELNRWKEFINKKKDEIIVNEGAFPYLSQKDNWNLIKDRITVSYLYEYLYNYFDDIFKEKEQVIPNFVTQVDKMINDLVSNYDVEEGKIQNEILKNNIIIEENGNLDKAYKRFDEEKSVFQSSNSFYSYLTDISLYPEKNNIFHITRKFAISKSKKFIIDSIKNNFDDVTNLDIKIKIGDWEGITKDGSNEKELRQSYSMFCDDLFHKEVYADKFLNMKTIIGIVLVLIGIICGYMYNSIAYIAAVVGLFICGVEYKSIYDNRTTKLKKVEDIKKKGYIVIGNNIAEIVDYLKVDRKTKTNYDELMAYLNNLNYENYIMSNTDSNHRKIDVGGKNE